MSEPAVAILIFNRPQQTARLIEALRVVKPGRVLVVADGPRAGNSEDEENVRKCHALLERIDWDCTLERNIAERNLGCRRRVSGGLDWVFSRSDRAIILEDDCLPHPSFFRYAGELLEFYADEPRIMSVSGTNFSRKRLFPESYSYSRYVRVWGWASWRRAWQNYDVDLKAWQTADQHSLLAEMFENSAMRKFWRAAFDRITEQQFDTWDYQWSFLHFVNHSLSIIPTVNLISNTGFGPDATHTKRANTYQNLPVFAMDDPLLHPGGISPNAVFDRDVEQNQFGASLRVRIRNMLAAYVRGWIH